MINQKDEVLMIINDVPHVLFQIFNRFSIYLLQYLFKLSILVTIEMFIIVSTLVYQTSVLTDLNPRLLRSLATNYGHENNSNVNHYGDSVFTQSIDFAQYSVSIKS